MEMARLLNEPLHQIVWMASKQHGQKALLSVSRPCSVIARMFLMVLVGDFTHSRPLGLARLHAVQEAYVTSAIGYGEVGAHPDNRDVCIWAQQMPQVYIIPHLHVQISQNPQ